jgi:Na+/melibiose symporter-like transporter
MDGLCIAGVVFFVSLWFFTRNSRKQPPRIVPKRGTAYYEYLEKQEQAEQLRRIERNQGWIAMGIFFGDDGSNK